MHDGYLQNVRYKLQRRVRRLNAANSDQFLYALKRFWVFFDNSPILRGLTEHLEAEFPKCQDTVEKILKSDRVVGETE